MIKANEKTVKELMGRTVVTVTGPGYFPRLGMGRDEGKIIGLTPKHPKFDFGQEFIVQCDNGEMLYCNNLKTPGVDKGIGCYLIDEQGATSVTKPVTIMTLAITEKRPEEIRVVYYESAKLYAVEMKSHVVGSWIVQAEWRTEQEALEDAINWYK